MSATQCTLDTATLLAALHKRLAAADALSEACKTAIAAGEISSESQLASALAAYAETFSASSTVSDDIAVFRAFLSDDPMLLPSTLRARCVPGFRFHLQGRRIQPGWLDGKPVDNFVLNYIEFNADGAIAFIKSEQSQADAAHRERERLSRTKREREAREVLRASGLAFDRQRCVPVFDEFKSAFNADGVSELNAYLDRIERSRFATMIAAEMADGKALHSAVSSVRGQLEVAFRNKAISMTKMRRYRAGES